MNKKSIVINQAITIIFTILVLLLLIFISSKAISIFAKQGKENIDTQLVNDLNAYFDEIKNTGVGSKIKVSLSLKDAAPLCFVDMDYKSSFSDGGELDKNYKQIYTYVKTPGFSSNVFLQGINTYLDAGNITIDKDNDNFPDDPELKDGPFLCITSSKALFFLTNNGRNIMVSLQ